MQWTQLISSGVPAIAVVPLGAPWPVAVLIVVGLVAYGWDRYLSHLENMKALDKTTSNQVPHVVRAITDHNWRRRRRDGPQT